MRIFTAVVFDMDGVLIDSEPVIRRAASLAGEDFGKTLTNALYAELIGLPGPKVEAALISAFGADFPLDDSRVSFQRHYRAHIDTHGMRTKPGITMLLAELLASGVPIAVATQTRSGSAEIALEAAGLRQYFPVCITGDQVANGKPAPDIFLRAAATLAVDPTACIALEDSEVGAHAAVGAGMWTLLIPDVKQPSAATAALVHEIFPDMPAATARVRDLLRHGVTPGPRP